VRRRFLSADRRVARNVEEPAPARRLRPAGWRDPRVVIGVVVMATSVLVGAAVVGDHDEPHTALTLRHDVAPGASLGGADVRWVRADIGDTSSAEHYYLDGAALAAGAVATRALAAGELLPRAAVRTGSADPRAQVALSVAVNDLPATVQPGSVVDVWVLPEGARSDPLPRAGLVLEDVPVVRIGTAGTNLAPQTSRQVIVALGAAASGPAGRRALADALGRAAAGRVLVVGRA